MSEIKEQKKNETEPVADSMDNAIVLDLGKKKRKQIKQLRKGRGKLIDTVQSCLGELRAAGSMDATAQAVIVVVAEKPEKAPWL